jgi:5-methyltetrahydropteroyltriglutamate--homocysteine methyltransferase
MMSPTEERRQTSLTRTGTPTQVAAAPRGEEIDMHCSTERILTTHTGSLPRPQRVVELLLEEQKHPHSRTKELAQAVHVAVTEVVQKQLAAGIDIINDGEQGRTDYTTHVKDRLSGFDGPSSPPLGTGEPDFPELSAMLAYFASPFQHRPACSGPVGWKDFSALEADIAQAKQAMAGSKATEWFMTSPSPGQIARYLKNQHYPSDEAYLFALADVMAREYRAIVDAGFVLQIDCPDLALSRHMVFSHLSLEEFRKVITVHVEALNHALKDIAPDRMRMHICWASTQGPHHKDVPLKDIVDIVLKGRPQAVSFPGANPRHGHEWKVWKDVKLPDGKIIIPGVIDSTSNFVEHPELVADRIVQYANVVGRENMIAGVDCGFGTFAGRLQVDSKIVWMKLASLAEGAQLASRQLW